MGLVSSFAKLACHVLNRLIQVAARVASESLLLRGLKPSKQPRKSLPAQPLFLVQKLVFTQVLSMEVFDPCLSLPFFLLFSCFLAFQTASLSPSELLLNMSPMSTSSMGLSCYFYYSSWALFFSPIQVVPCQPHFFDTAEHAA